MATIISKRGRVTQPQIIHHDEDEPPENWEEIMGDYLDDEEVLRKTTEGVIVDHNWIETDYD